MRPLASMQRGCHHVGSLHCASIMRTWKSDCPRGAATGACFYIFFGHPWIATIIGSRYQQGRVAPSTSLPPSSTPSLLLLKSRQRRDLDILYWCQLNRCVGGGHRFIEHFANPPIIKVINLVYYRWPWLIATIPWSNKSSLLQTMPGIHDDLDQEKKRSRDLQLSAPVAWIRCPSHIWDPHMHTPPIICGPLCSTAYL